MKAFTGDLRAFFDELRADPDAMAAKAECFTFTLEGGRVLRYTNADIDIDYGGHTFRADGPKLDGMKYHATLGLNVDEQELTVSCDPAFAPWPGATASFIDMLKVGVFDLCRFRREAVFFSDFIGGHLRGGVILFEGYLSRTEDAGATRATVTVSDDLVILQNQMPRNSYCVTCNHALYGDGCGLDPADFTTLASVGAGSTDRTLVTPLALFQHVGGYVEFTTGANAGLRATIKNVRVGQNLTLSYPLLYPNAVGDQFKLVDGCDHTLPTCAGHFDNRANFRGFPFVPPMQYAQ